MGPGMEFSTYEHSTARHGGVDLQFQDLEGGTMKSSRLAWAIWDLVSKNFKNKQPLKTLEIVSSGRGCHSDRYCTVSVGPCEGQGCWEDHVPPLAGLFSDQIGVEPVISRTLCTQTLMSESNRSRKPRANTYAHYVISSNSLLEAWPTYHPGLPLSQEILFSGWRTASCICSVSVSGKQNTSYSYDILFSLPKKTKQNKTTNQPNKQKTKQPSSISLYKLPAEGMAQIKDGSSCLKISVLKVGLRTSNDLIKGKIPHSCTQARWGLVSSRCRQVVS